MGPPAVPPYLSGIVVTTTAERIADVVSALEMLPGVDVRRTDTATGRIVVVQEAPTIEAEVDGLRRIQTLAHVLSANLVFHYFGEAAQRPAPLGTPHPGVAKPHGDRA